MKTRSIVTGILVCLSLVAQPAAALVGTFTDVDSSAWYAPYALELSEAGIFDQGTYFRPADSLNRAELVKLVIEATGGLGDYSPPAYPAFDDVPLDAWFSPYVEEAATRGIASGYKDETGSLTGYFGPGDTVTRAQAAKILVEAFELETANVSELSFPDVSSSDWFYGYVQTAAAIGIVSGYDSGSYGPNDAVTRAQIAKMISLSLNPPSEGEPKEDIEKVTSEPPAEEPGSEPEPQGEMFQPNLEGLSSEAVASGEGEILVAKYTFSTNNEGFRVETVTIVNDITGDQLGDQPEGTLAIKKIILKFPDKEGMFSTAESTLGTDGRARFANLDFFAARDAETQFEVYVQLNTIAEVGEALSGEVFRLGLQDIGNLPDSFRAVGDISGFVVSGFGSGNFALSNASIEPFTVRKAVPVIETVDGNENLTTGENTLLTFKVSAEGAGSIGLARLVFDVNVFEDSGAGLSVEDFKLYRGSTYLDDEVTVYDATGGQDVSVLGGGSIASGSSSIIVSFNQEESISAGSSKTFSLRANVIGSENDDSISTGLATGDDFTPLTGLTAVNQENTGKIFVNGDSSAGIFTVATDFSQSLATARNIIWSDKSAELHQYPTVSSGSVTTDTGSHDWTNGYQLKLSSFSSHTLSR